MNRFDLNIQRSIKQLLGLLLLGCFTVINLQAQSARLWEKSYGSNSSEEVHAIVTKPNGDHLMGGYIENIGIETYQFYLLRTDVDGDLIYEKNFGLPVVAEFSWDMTLTDEGVIMVGEERANISQPADILVMHIDEYGKQLWRKSYGSTRNDVARAVIQVSDGGYIIAGEAGNEDGNDDMFLLKIDSTGEEVWMQTFDNVGSSDRATDVIEKADNSGFVIVGKSGNVGADMFLIETDADGNEVNRNLIERQGFIDAKAIVLTTDGYMVAGGITGSLGTRGFISKIASNLSLEQISFYGNGDEQGLNDLIRNESGNYTAGGFILESSSPQTKAYLVEVKETLGLPVNQRIMGAEKSRIINGLSKAGNKRGVVAAGIQNDAFFIVSDAYFLRVEEGLLLPEKFIEGKVIFDTGNCMADLGESPLGKWIVTCEGDTETLFATTDENGNYYFRVDEGNFTVRLKADNETWNPCFNDLNIVIDEATDTVELNFPVQADYQCAYMEIDASATQLTKSQTTDYQIFYCNKGTVDAQNAEIEILLDSFMTFNSSTLPITTQNGSLLTFDLDEVKTGDCGKFSINVTLDADEPLLGQTHTFTARIVPDSICIPTDLQWDGSSIEVSAVCESDSVRFTVKNVGSDMTQGRQSLVIEDAVIIRPAPPVQLDSGDTQEIVFPANGTTYRLISEQSEFHPGQSKPTVAVEGCTTTPNNSSIGHVTRFEEDEKNPFVSIEPIENEDSNTDFTLLRGYPKGSQDSMITSQTDLEYHFRFENCGNDTIKRVVIRDTLSQNLDITSIRYGTSSHPYSFRVYETGVVKFIFDDINLLPITVNQKGSRGFVKFKISQKPNNPAGTLIENSVAMNQDFEAVKITNRTRHIVGGELLTDFIEVRPTATNDLFYSGVNVNIFPNPAVSHVTFDISGVSFTEYKIEIFDPSGKIISQETQSQNRFTLNRERLKEGAQFYRVTADGNLLSTGQIIVH